MNMLNLEVIERERERERERGGREDGIKIGFLFLIITI
jgi:hypothetical protein